MSPVLTSVLAADWIHSQSQLTIGQTGTSPNVAVSITATL